MHSGLWGDENMVYIKNNDIYSQYFDVCMCVN